MEEYNPSIHTVESDFKGKTLHFPSVMTISCFFSSLYPFHTTKRYYKYSDECGLTEITNPLRRHKSLIAILLSTDTLFPTIPDFDYSCGVYVDWTNLLIRWYTPELRLAECMAKPALRG